MPPLNSTYPYWAILLLVLRRITFALWVMCEFSASPPVFTQVFLKKVLHYAFTCHCVSFHIVIYLWKLSLDCSVINVHNHVWVLELATSLISSVILFCTHGRFYTSCFLLYSHLMEWILYLSVLPTSNLTLCFLTAEHSLIAVTRA